MPRAIVDSPDRSRKLKTHYNRGELHKLPPHSVTWRWYDVAGRPGSPGDADEGALRKVKQYLIKHDGGK